MIWYQNYSLEAINSWNKNTLVETLNITFCKITPTSLAASMPVGPMVHQPMGMLHGGASCVLAESVGSVASNMVVDLNHFAAVGHFIDANHIRPVEQGTVIATATALHLGRTSHVWDIRITNDNEELICVSRLTNAVIKKMTARNSAL